MEVENITTLPDEAFIVEAIILLERVSVEVVDVVDPSKEMIGTISLPTFDISTEMTGTMSSPMISPHVGMIGITSLLVEIGVEALDLHNLDAIQTSLY